ncbi:AmmeMemoRadiSam system radical SAM enzyme, partial [bacterium]|nr:AmmeMemoRadiSam system radical SAM enzyme [bacterium]
EITNLIIPGHNDGDADLADLAQWIADELGPLTPTHLSAYSPRHRLGAAPTPLATLEGAYGIFKQRLRHVYLGNVRSVIGSNTNCCQCDSELIRRQGYATEIVGLDGATCRHCGAENQIVTRPYS